jgi:hypothetical protein
LIAKVLQVGQINFPDVSEMFIAGGNFNFKLMLNYIQSILPHCSIKFISESDILMAASTNQSTIVENSSFSYGIGKSDGSITPLILKNQSLTVNDCAKVTVVGGSSMLLNIYEGNYALYYFDSLICSIYVQLDNFFSQGSIDLNIGFDKHNIIQVCVTNTNDNCVIFKKAINRVEDIDNAIVHEDYSQYIPESNQIEGLPAMLPLGPKLKINNHQYLQRISSILDQITNADATIISAQLKSILVYKSSLHLRIILSVSNMPKIDKGFDHSDLKTLKDGAKLINLYERFEVIRTTEFLEVDSITHQLGQLEILESDLDRFTDTTDQKLRHLCRKLCSRINYHLNMLELLRELTLFRKHSGSPEESFFALVLKFYQIVQLVIRMSVMPEYIQNLLTKDVQSLDQLIQYLQPLVNTPSYTDVKTTNQVEFETFNNLRSLSTELNEMAKSSLLSISKMKFVIHEDGKFPPLENQEFFKFQEYLIKMQIKLDCIDYMQNKSLRILRKEIIETCELYLHRTDTIKEYYIQHLLLLGQKINK